jgi:hypothetical protein
MLGVPVLVYATNKTWKLDMQNEKLTICLFSHTPQQMGWAFLQGLIGHQE